MNGRVQRVRAVLLVGQQARNNRYGAGIANECDCAVVSAAARLREAGLPCPVVSVGSTPTAFAARNLDGVTELCAGVYVFFDLVMAGVGVPEPPTWLNARRAAACPGVPARAPEGLKFVRSWRNQRAFLFRCFGAFR
jgi:D-serine deaminase-like pyridoxal phosphate-dependent protein